MGRILVTGANGFVGRHLVDHLSTAGHDLTLAVRRSDTCPQTWIESRAKRIVVTGPLESSAHLDEALLDVSSIVHLAGLAHLPRQGGNDEAFVAANVTATQRLSKAAMKHGVGNFIHMSSLAAIAPNASQSIISDKTAGTPPTAFGQTKRNAERAVAELADHDMLAVSLRPPLIVGWDAPGNWSALQRLAATGLPLPFASVNNMRSLIGISSLVDAIELLCTGGWSSDKSGEYCITDEDSVSLPQIIGHLRHGMKRSQRLFPFPVSTLEGTMRLAGLRHLSSGLFGDLRVDASRFRTSFAFTSKHSLRDAIVASGSQYALMKQGQTPA